MWHSCCPFVVRGEILHTNRQGPRVLYDNPGDTLLRRRYIYRPWSTLQVPGYAAVLCYAVGSCRPWSTLQVPGFVPISGLLHAVGTGLEYPAGIRFAAETRRDSFTPSVPALEYPAEVPGVVRNSGGTPLRRRFRPREYPAGARCCAKFRRYSFTPSVPASRVPCRWQVMCETPAVLCYAVGTGLEYPAGTYQVYC